jgi:hypothetical protein
METGNGDAHEKQVKGDTDEDDIPGKSLKLDRPRSSRAETSFLLISFHQIGVREANQIPSR